MEVKEIKLTMLEAQKLIDIIDIAVKSAGLLIAEDSLLFVKKYKKNSINNILY